MMLAWMVYASLVALLLALAARILEKTTRQRGGPVRGLWVLALTGSFLIPMLPKVGPTRDEVSQSTISVSDPRGTRPHAATAPNDRIFLRVPVVTIAEPVPEVNLDPWLMLGWASGSLVLLSLLLASHRNVSNKRRNWESRQVDGRWVWISDDTGPAVIGHRGSGIVIPAWLLTLGSSERALILTHEEEHIRAGDSQLLLAAFLCWAAMPWNLALWWIWRSLTRTVEVDCDLRVLARGIDPRVYSRLLVTVLERSTAGPITLAGFVESHSLLERRVRLMLSTRSQRWWPRAMGSFAVAFVCVVAACRVEQPGRPPVPATGVAYSAGEGDTLARLPYTATVIPRKLMEGLQQVSEGVRSAELASAPHPDRPHPEGLVDRASLDAILQAAVKRFYPNLLIQPIAGARANLYFLVDARGEMVRTGLDTERRSGPCMGILMAGLGEPDDRTSIQSGGCGSFTFGPNKTAVFWAALGARPGEEGASPTGPFPLGAVAAKGLSFDRLIRSAIAQYHPDALRGSLSLGEELWFVVDRDDRVIHTGRSMSYGSSSAARADLERRIPGIRLGAMTMSSSVKDNTGRTIQVTWARLEEQGSSSASELSRQGRDPFTQARTFAVSSQGTDQEVRIVLRGKAVADPNAFRVEGGATRIGDTITVRTPFIFDVVTTAPFSARLSAGSSSANIQVITESDGSRSQMSGTFVFLERDDSGTSIRATAGSIRTERRPQFPPEIVVLPVDGQ
jgi:beta-lactamase regulating signal transducer with metallopeptidase domain